MVSATVEGRQTMLAFSPTAICDGFGFCGPGWAGTLSLSGLARGQKTLTVTASDIFGGTGQATVFFVFDTPPVLTITEPLDFTVARPTLHVNVGCTDDDPAGCASLTIVANDNGTMTQLAAGTSTIDQTISLSSFEGRVVTLLIKARDSAGQMIQQARTIYVDSSPRLSEIGSVGGAILDVTSESILFIDTSNGGAVLTIRSRTSGAEVQVPTIPGKTPQYGYLTPTGVIYAAAQGEDSLTAGVYDWRGSGAPIALGLPNSTESLAVAGEYAIWAGERGTTYTGQVILFRRHLPSGTNVEVVDGGVGNWKNGVATNGDVVFWTAGNASDYNISRYRNGTLSRLTNDTQLWNTYVITDGINVVYRKHTPCCANQTYAITMYGDSGEVTLAPARTQEPVPGHDYAARNGWIAFTQAGIGGELQVLVRSPQGQNSQLSFFGSSSRIDVKAGPSAEGALSPDGEVVFLHAGTRYLAGPSRAALPVNSALGSSLWLDGQWVVVIGRSLFLARTAAHDFDRNGTSDVLWQHTAGNMALWLMDGATVLANLDLGNVAGWIPRVGDFNGDGIADILWQHTSSGNVALWLMSPGSAVQGSVSLGNVAGWTPSIGDFNGDGIADILWQHTSSGNVALWLMSPRGAVQGSVWLGSVAGWTPSIGDFNGDGIADILWQHTSSGNVALWLMNPGGGVKSSVGLGNLGGWTPR